MSDPPRPFAALGRGGAGRGELHRPRPVATRLGRAGPEFTLAGGAFLVGYLRRFGVTGAGVGSQTYIGQLLAYGARLNLADLPTVLVAGLIAALASVVPCLLSGPAEHPPPVPALLAAPAGGLRPELIMGLQAAIAGIVIVALNAAVGLTESAGRLPPARMSSRVRHPPRSTG